MKCDRCNKDLSDVQAVKDGDQYHYLCQYDREELLEYWKNLREQWEIGLSCS